VPVSQIFSGSRRHFWDWAFEQFGYPGSHRQGDLRAEVVVFTGSGGLTVTVTAHIRHLHLVTYGTERMGVRGRSPPAGFWGLGPQKGETPACWEGLVKSPEQTGVMG